MQAFRAIISRHHTHITHITITVDCVDWFIICVFYLSIYHVYVMKDEHRDDDNQNFCISTGCL